MNLPNKLTVSRLGLTVLFIIFLLVPFEESAVLPFAYAHTVALVIFVVASLTDWLDGKIARSRNLQTNFGALMDPLADKVLTGAAFICFLADNQLGEHGAWVVIIIITREFVITGLRLIAGAENKVLAADKLGKHKTAWQMITIIVVLVKMSFEELIGRLAEQREWMDQVLRALGHAENWTLGITVVLTVYSGAAYLWRHRDLWLENN